MDKIDFDKSIRAHRLKTYNRSFNYYFNWFERIFVLLTGVAIVVSACADVRSGYLESNLPMARIIVFIVALFFGLWIIYGVINVDRLVEIQGGSNEINKQIINEVLSEKFIDVRFRDMGETLEGYRHGTLQRTPKEILVLFKDSSIYISIINKVRFGQTDSPFHVIGNMIDIKEVREVFLKRLETTGIGS